MRIVGIVAEFNPFHHGHLYHLQSARRLTEADCVVIVMSGNYTQRGEPALVSKWARAEMALLAGADLVIELPVAYAMGSAEYFAFGAVRLLDSLGVVNAICFGSESGNIENLQNTRNFLRSSFPAASHSLPQDKKPFRAICGANMGKTGSHGCLKAPTTSWESNT